MTCDPARFTSSAGGAWPLGPASTRWKPKRGAASSHERAMLQPMSPTKAMRLPAMEPACSSMVKTSDSTCTGCPSSDSALTTGTSTDAMSSSLAVLKVR